MKAYAILSALMASAFATAPAFAAMNVSSSDAQWLNATVRGSNAEVQSCTAADNATQDASIHAFCARAIADHTKAAKMGTQMGERMGVTISQAPPASDVAAMNRLKGESGQTFINDFKHVQIADHQKNITATQAAMTATSNPQLKAFEQKTLTALRAHLALAEQIH